MNWTEKLQLTGLTAVITAGLTVLMLWRLIPTWFTRLAGDEAPIVMTGGSFQILQFGAESLGRDSGNKRLVQASVRKVTSIAVTLPTGTTTIPNIGDVDGTLTYKYCETAGCTETAQGHRPHIVVLAFYNHTAKAVEISGANVHTWNGIDGRKYEHPDRNRLLQEVTYTYTNGTPQTVVCGGNCLITIVTAK